MTINIISVGKLKEKYLKDACDEYLKRIKRYAKPIVTEIAEYRLPTQPSKTNIIMGLNEEGKAILSKISPQSLTVALCIEGEQLSSKELSKKISNAAIDGKGEINFIIGGSFGLSDEVKNAADLRLSMSKMTFPHQLARVMILEQIYRTFQILSNGKYHK